MKNWFLKYFKFKCLLQLSHPKRSISRTDVSFEILKSKNIVNSRCLGQVGNENVSPQAILDKIL